MNRQLFHAMQFDDADAAIAFLTAVGFRDNGVHRDESGAVVHAQFDWRDTGGVMFGSVRRADDPDDSDFLRTSGHAACYCVLAADDEVDATFERAVAAGATPVQAPTDQDYGGRSCTVRDAEGNQWSFGSYPGA
ncbi:putative glyoxalase superfamily protein PhnB [Barrientosiimonas humi]|uniref:Putative glyoxalase superfamily protein PhnB n=1 Tax=Barrientosiimonas humi TaxID=999931 RepID=A0A542XB14_9MICO|nr:VOC family protein [Barrientosiimonas humi]TQL33049.1 putative glyoxalase superfamily protein PhnB [Barrientosiimonas humi]CAG7573039.1 hypothetical protein BH39T_PBIAJDOK_01664 [Barrientosiimonas humi]